MVVDDTDDCGEQNNDTVAESFEENLDGVYCLDRIFFAGK